MAEFLSPGIFIEEISTTTQAVEAVGTSTMSIVGWTERGPVDQATLVTSFDDYLRKMGEYTNNSRVPISVQAFFANGGSRAYVVRVVPTDAVAGESCITNAVAAENPVFAPAESETSVGPFVATLAKSPLDSSALTINWTEAVQAVGTLTFTGQPADTETVVVAGKTYTFQTVLTNVDGNVLIGATTADSINNLIAAINLGAGSGTVYAAATTANPSAGAVLGVGTSMKAYALVGGTAGNALTTTTTVVNASWGGATMAGGTAAAAKTATLSGTATVGGTNAARISAASINRTTGVLSVTFAARTIGTNNGPGTNSITVSYSECQWGLTAANKGSWSGRMTLRVAGNSNFFTYGTQATAGAGEYSKFDVSILVENTLTGEDEIKETYEELVFDDATDSLYFPDVLNDNSDFVVVTDYGDLDVPASFKGVDQNETMGNGTGAQTLFTGTLSGAPLVKTSLVVTYTDAGNPVTLTCDVNGNITGTGLDTTQTNTVNYTTGAFTLNFLVANAPDNLTPISAAYVSMPATSSVDYVFTGGSDGTLTGVTFDRSQFSAPALAASKRGMYALGKVDEVMQLVIPDWAGDATVANDQLDYAESRKDLFVILTTPQNYDASDAFDYRSITFNRKSKYAAMYWPWIKVTDPLNATKTLSVPPLAWVAGVYARTDQTRNVGKAPGGTVDGALRFLTGLESNPDKADRDLVYPIRVNPLINTTQTGLAVWGVRTLSPTNDVLRYINAVRLFQFVEKSIFNSTFNFVFESISANLYTQIKTTVDGFLLNLYTTGHFAGSTPAQAYFVICDESNNPPEVANAGQVIVDIGIAPNRPGEFIRFRFSQKTLTA